MRTAFRIAAALCAGLVVLVGQALPASAQTKPVQSSPLSTNPSAELTPPLYLDNLRSCLSGTFNCRVTLLTQDDVAKVQAAEYLRNFTSCLGGYRVTCKHALLLPTDLERVRSAEYHTNLKTCLTGYSLGCRHIELRVEDLAAVRKVEYQTNLNRCTSSYRLGCKQDLLTPEDRERVVSAPTSSTQQSGSLAPSTVAPLSKLLPPGCAENGSCYGDTSVLTGRPKTVAVSGYFRSNGTYVRGHYRSAPSRR
jgi:hypothetical protein